MTDRPFEKAYDETLDLYANWLASYTDGEFSPEVFALDLQKYSSLRSSMDTEWHHLLVIRADFGDDGGPATLLSFIEPMQGEIVTMIQSFDTYTQTIYDTTLNDSPMDGWIIRGDREEVNNNAGDN